MKTVFNLLDPLLPKAVGTLMGSLDHILRATVLGYPELFLWGLMGRDTFWCDSPHLSHLLWPVFGIKSGSKQNRILCSGSQGGPRQEQVRLGGTE